MLIKKAEDSKGLFFFFPRTGKLKFFAWLFLLFIYTVSVFFIGGKAYKDGIFGKVLVPIIKENISIPINYFKSLKANPEHIILDVKHEDFQRLAYKREVALSKGVLISDKEDFVPGKIRWSNKTYRVTLRLKGDLSDHWEDNTKWSFRIKVRDNETIMGMREFSLQHPRTRGFMNDWSLHRLLRYIGGFIILRYDFVKFRLNGKNLGIYLVEEHFDEMLLKNNKVIKSPIIRIYDHLLWYNVNPLYGFTKSHLNEHYSLSPIDAFNSGDINKDQTSQMYFNQAKNLLESFRQGNLKTHEVFDVDKLADLFAVIDLLGYRHSTGYSNIRFYYNPVTSFLEPIGYDNTFIFEATEIEGLSKKIKILPADESETIDYDVYQKWYNTFFYDEVFFRKYIKALEKVADKAFLDDFFKKTEDDFRKNMNILHKTFPGYRFDKKAVLYKNQEFIRNILNPDVVVQGYFAGYDPVKKTIKIEIGNIHSLPVEIKGLFIDKDVFIPVSSSFIIQPKRQFEFVDFKEMEFLLPDSVTWVDDDKGKLSIACNILEANNERKVTVSPWSYLDKNFLKNDFIRQDPNFEEFSFFSVDKDTSVIAFKKGEWEIKKDIIIPEGFVVTCQPGTVLTLLNDAKILSYSPVVFRGTNQYPIVIKSGVDSPGQGIVVIRAKEKSVFENVVFEGLSAPSRGDWKMPSAVTFYESPILIYECDFLNTKTGDALSVINTEAKIDKTHFKDNSENALSVIYGNGEIKNTSFSNNGRDSINSLGSELTCDNIIVEKCTDAGVNGREISNINITNSKFVDSGVAVISADMSSVDINGVTIKRCNIGLEVLKEQSIFGPAKMQVNGLSTENNKTDFFVDKKSKLLIDGRYITSKE